MARSEMNILVRTRPLGQGNYGGLLQAYAMQQVLEELSVNSLTDVTRGDQADVGARRGLLERIRAAVKYTVVRANLPFPSKKRWVGEHVQADRDAPLNAFVARNIRTTRLYQNDGQVSLSVLSQVDAFLVGSDQVWRGAYGRIPSYLFDFLAADDPRPRFAYAASFGTESLDEYSSELLRTTRALAGRFDAISVREHSGVEICSRAWGVEATHVLDPTLLLSRDAYSELADREEPYAAPNALVSYVLDPDPTIRDQVLTLQDTLGVALQSLLPPAPKSLRDFRKRRSCYQRPSVEQWLRAIRDARFIVTDSFHGTVFALINNIPFLTIVNHARGAARFESLLKDVGLEGRMIEIGDTIDSDLISAGINWEDVNMRLNSRRAESYDFLSRALERVRPDEIGGEPRDE